MNIPAFHRVHNILAECDCLKAPLITWTCFSLLINIYLKVTIKKSLFLSLLHNPNFVAHLTIFLFSYPLMQHTKKTSFPPTNLITNPSTPLLTFTRTSPSIHCSISPLLYSPTKLSWFPLSIARSSFPLLIRSQVFSIPRSHPIPWFLLRITSLIFHNPPLAFRSPSPVYLMPHVASYTFTRPLYVLEASPFHHPNRGIASLSS